jgi:trimeric autotransporter adhesin
MSRWLAATARRSVRVPARIALATAVTGAVTTAVTTALTACAGAGATAPRDALPVASVTVTPEAATIPVGLRWQFTATPRDARGAAVAGRAVAWASSDSSVVFVDPHTGRAVARRTGAVGITATCAGRSASVTVWVVSVIGGAGGDSEPAAAPPRAPAARP